MIEKRPICPDRVRKISGSFAFIEHRFIRDGFLDSLSHPEIALYLFLVLVSDRKGLSHYSYDKICTILGLDLQDYILARDLLIEKDLLAFDGSLFQVLALPENRPCQARVLTPGRDMEIRDPATIRQLIKTSLGRQS